MSFKLALTTALLFIFINESQAGILADLEDGSHTWTSNLVPESYNSSIIFDSLLEMSDTFNSNGTVSFDYVFTHFATVQNFWAKSGSTYLELSDSNVIYNDDFAIADGSHIVSGNVTNEAVNLGDVFYFKANTLSAVHSLGPTVTLQITNFTFTPSSSESMEESAVPEPGSLALLAFALPVFLVSRKSLKLSR